VSDSPDVYANISGRLTAEFDAARREFEAALIRDAYWRKYPAGGAYMTWGLAILGIAFAGGRLHFDLEQRDVRRRRARAPPEQ
jgi:hypothetical protein